MAGLWDSIRKGADHILGGVAGAADKAWDATIGFNPAMVAAGSGLGGSWQGEQDAMRHIMMSAGLTQRYGKHAARGLMQAYELTSPEQYFTAAGRRDKAMDYANNNVGFDLGERGGSFQDIYESAKSLVGMAANRPPSLYDAFSGQSRGAVVLRPTTAAAR